MITIIAMNFPEWFIKNLGNTEHHLKYLQFLFISDCIFVRLFMFKENFNLFKSEHKSSSCLRIQIVEQKLYLLAWFCGKVRAIFPFFVFQSLLKAELLEIPFTSNFITISQIYSSLTTGSLVLTVNIFRRQKIKSLCIHGIHIYRKFMIIEIKKFDIRKASMYYFLSNRSHLQII